MSTNTGDTRTWLERLADKIPGYGGYVEKERRRDIDKLHREHLADRVRSLKSPLTEVMRELSSGGRLLEVGPVDSAIKKVDHFENRLRFASYGYSGFFDVVKIEEQQLDSIYRFDLALVEDVEKLEAKVAEVKQRAGAADSLKAVVSEVVTLVDEAQHKFDERYRAINEYGQGAPGRPLFSNP
jgi:hypothetical protein